MSSHILSSCFTGSWMGQSRIFRNLTLSPGRSQHQVKIWNLSTPIEESVRLQCKMWLTLVLIMLEEQSLSCFSSLCCFTDSWMGRRTLGDFQLSPKCRRYEVKFSMHVKSLTLLFILFFPIYWPSTIWRGNEGADVATFYFPRLKIARFFPFLWFVQEREGKLLWKAKIICCTILVFSKMNIVT